MSTRQWMVLRLQQGALHLGSRAALGRSAVAAAVASWLFLFACSVAFPQAAHLSYAQGVVAQGLGSPYGDAVDASGAVYVVDRGTSTVFRETPSAGGYTQSTVASGLDHPEYVAVDSSGNVFISVASDVLEVSASGATSSLPSVGGRGWSFPTGVAVDASGDVFVSDTLAGIVKETNSGGTYSASTALSVAQLPGAGGVNGIGLDASGNLYFGAVPDTEVFESVVSAGTYGAPAVVVAGFPDTPNDVAVDSAGNLYATDSGAGELLRFSSGSYSQTAPASASAGTRYGTLISPAGISVDNSGTMYVADAGTGKVFAIQPSAANFGALGLGRTTSSLSLNFVFDSAGTLGSIAVLTQGASGLDFNDAGTGSCTPGSAYPVGQGCSVDVTFSPKRAGARPGGVDLYDTSGNVFGTGYAYGNGQAPQLAFSPSTSSLVLSSPNALGVAVDASGSVYVADAGGQEVRKETAAGGAYTDSTVGGGAFDLPQYVAVDGSGAVFHSDTESDFLWKSSPSTPGYAPRVAVARGLGNPQGVAVDGSGNVFIADAAVGILKETYSGTGYTQSIVTSGLVNTSGLAVDGAGNLFVAIPADGQVFKLTYNAGNYSTPAVVASGLSNPHGVAVDGSGDLYVADTGTGRLLLFGPGSLAATVLATGLTNPFGVAVDQDGNVYVSESGKDVIKLDRADLPSFSFASTPVGRTSSDSPQMLTVTNIGNETLNFDVPTTGTNPSIGTGFSLGSGSTCPVVSPGSAAGTLGTGASCSANIDFTPTAAGANSGTLIFSDNNLDLSPSTQSVALSGSATLLTVTAGSSSIAYGTTSAGLSATISFSGGPTPSGAVTFTVDSGVAVSGSCSGTSSPLACTATYNTGGLSTGTHIVTVTDAGDSNYANGSSTGTLTVTPGSLSITVNSQSIALGIASTTLSGTVAYAGTAAPTGAVTFVVGSGSPVSAVCTGSSSPLACAASYATGGLAAGTYTIVVAVAADSNYAGTSNFGMLTVVASPSVLPLCTLGTLHAVIPASSTVANAASVTANCADPQGQPITMRIDWGDGGDLESAVNGPNAHTYPSLSTQMTYRIVLTATDSSGNVGSATESVIVSPSTVSVSPGASTTVSGSAPPQPPSAGTTTVTFVCSSVTGVINGETVSNVLPSQYGISCTSPTVSASPTSATPVNVTIQTTAGTATVARITGPRDTLLYALSLPSPGLVLLALGTVLPQAKRKRRKGLAAAGALLLLCFIVGGCGGSFQQPAVTPTPAATYYITITEVTVGGPPPTDFVQTSLIVPLPVAAHP